MKSVLLAAAIAAASAIPITPQMTSFGHAIKNGPLPAATELTTFQHTCGVPPCVVTQLHFPSIYPTGGGTWDWENGRFRAYIDNETTPSIDVSLLEIAFVGKLGAVGDSNADGSPFGIHLFGKTAKSGGVSSTVRIPFMSSLRTTIEAAPGVTTPSIFWFIIRGLEAYPVHLGGEIQLPDQARLGIYRNDNVTVLPGQQITVASAPASTAGVLLASLFDAQSSDFNYLEACVRLFVNGNAAQPIFLSSGTEDYFLSASYFDEGMFKAPTSGVTYDNGGGSMAAYKLHDRDVITWQAGMNMTWKNNEDPSCPTSWSARVTGTPEEAAAGAAAAAGVDASAVEAARAQYKRVHAGTTTAPAQYNTLVWYYSWPANAAELTFQGKPATSVY